MSDITITSGRTDDLMSALVHGLTTGEIEVVDNVPVLSASASSEFAMEMSSYLSEPIYVHPHLQDDISLQQKLRFDARTVSSLLKYWIEMQAAARTIDKKYEGFAGSLGKPIMGAPRRGANGPFYRSYELGAIYLTSSGVAVEVHGEIYKKYRSLGAETGLLGYPETDESTTYSGNGQFNHFQHGSIYWTPSAGAWEIHGGIRDHWLTMFSDRSWLGLPVSDEEDWIADDGQPMGRVSHFQRGTLGVRWQDSSFEAYPDSRIYQADIHNDLVNCSFQIYINSRGDWHYSGYMHNDGFAGCVARVVTTPMFHNADSKTFAVTAERSLGGTLDAESRNDVWEQSESENALVRENWDLMRVAAIRTTLKSNTTVGDVLAVLIPVGIVAVILSGGSGNQVCGPYNSVKRDPYTGRDVPSAGFQVTSNSQQCPRPYGSY